MATLEESRDAFLMGVGRWVPSEKESFSRILDDLIDWSKNQPDLVHADHEYEQGVVSFRRRGGPIFWSAYPKGDKGHGAKLEILSGSTKTLAEPFRNHALTVLTDMTREPLSVDTTLRIRFAALRSKASRDRIKQLLAELNAHLADPEADYEL